MGNIFQNIFPKVALPAAKELQGNFSDFIYQQDNDSKHNVKWMQADYTSTNLNPIEHLWDEIEAN